MAVPDFQSLMRPVLVALDDGQVRPGKDIRQDVRTALGLTEDDLAQVLSSGQTVFYNRIQWASTYLAKAGAVERPVRGQFRITGRGRHLLQTCPHRITIADLRQYPEFEVFRTARHVSTDTPVPDTDHLTPSERIEVLIAEMEAAVADDLLAATYRAGDEFLERLAVSLLTAMGYGVWSQRADPPVERCGDRRDYPPGRPRPGPDRDSGQMLGTGQDRQSPRPAGLRGCTPRGTDCPGCVHHHRPVLPGSQGLRPTGAGAGGADRWPGLVPADDPVRPWGDGQAKLRGQGVRPRFLR